MVRFKELFVFVRAASMVILFVKINLILLQTVLPFMACVHRRLEIWSRNKVRSQGLSIFAFDLRGLLRREPRGGEQCWNK